MMPTYLELGDEVIEVDLTTPWFAFDQHEQDRHQRWSNGAQLAAWIGLTALLVGLLVFSFFSATRPETCVSSMTVERGQAPVINEMTCL